MHRALALLTILALASGCVGGGSGGREGTETPCEGAEPADVALYFAEGYTMSHSKPTLAGSAPGNAFSSGFLTNELTEWLGAPAAAAFRVEGDMTLEFWARSTGTPAPLAYPIAGDQPGDAYRFFNQLGTTRALVPGSNVEFGPAAGVPGEVTHYVETFPAPPGGLFVEEGDRMRVLLTDLSLDGPEGSGHDILFGGATPSALRFTATCWAAPAWTESILFAHPVELAGNQGLLTGAVPAAEANKAEFPLEVHPDVGRLTFMLRQAGDPNPVKDDIDLVLLDASGDAAWGMGSPYSDETGTLWRANLDAAFPGGKMTIQVNSYSGVAYTGQLTVLAATAS